MALTPQYDHEILVDETDDSIEIAPSKTWQIDLETGRITRNIDGLAALKQFALKALMTERFRHVIYSDAYGNEIPRLIGSSTSRALLEIEIPRMVKDALEYDDRVESVNVELDLQGDKAYVTARIVARESFEEIAVEVTFNV